jgi:hypothetical protein
VLIADLSLVQVVVPLGAAAIGAASVAAVSRHLRRQELYVEAAQKINDYIDEAAKALKDMGDEDFDEEHAQLALGVLDSAAFHSRRLESEEVTERLRVAQFVLWDMLDAEERRGRLWVNRAMNDALNAVVEFMVLPRLLPLRRHLRVLPPNQFPNTVDLYIEIAEPKGDGEKPNWVAVRRWVSQRRKELREEEARAAHKGLRRLRLLTSFPQNLVGRFSPKDEHEKH